MTQDQLKDDLAYVAGVMQRNDTRRSDALIYVFWALAILIGFTWVDVQPRTVGIYWMIVGPVGGLLSALYSIHQGRKRGVRNAAEGRRWGAHFLIGMVGWFAAALPLMTGALPPSGANLYFLLVTGLVYALAGVHLDRGLLWPGVVALAGFVVMQFVHVPYSWTLTGVIIAFALLMSAVVARKGRSAS